MKQEDKNTNIPKRKLGENLLGVYAFFWILAVFFTVATVGNVKEGLDNMSRILMFIFTLLIALVCFFVPIFASIYKQRNLAHAREIEEYNAKILQQKKENNHTKNTKTPS